jgi:hypothetical protein
MRFIQAHRATLVLVALLSACSAPTTGVELPTTPAFTGSANAWGPESPGFNLEVILSGDGFGLVKFRQPNDADKIIYLDTWVRGLTPDTDYQLQRAVDTTLDGNCTSAAWLTLGAGLTPQPITTDDRGTGRANLWRDLATIAIGTRFDIHFRIVNAATGAAVLTSACYEYVLTQ